jgi:transcriptional regulator with XRE-family HTH domain
MAPPSADPIGSGADPASRDASAGPTEPALRDAFRQELQRLRTAAGLSKKALARRLAFDPSYISHIESGRHRPSEDFAVRADDALGGGGKLHRLWTRLHQATPARGGRSAPPQRLPVPEQADPAAGSTDVVVEEEDARLILDGPDYIIRVRRSLRSVGSRPVALFWVKIAVGADPDRPLAWDTLDFKANAEGMPMAWRAAVDQPTVKQVWLQFKNDEYEFPLYPGEQTTIEYSYRVPRGTWGDFFQRAIRLPTNRLSLRVRLPGDPRVWGTETSLTADHQPLSIAPTVTDFGDDHEWCWEIPRPPLNARFRVEWRFGNETADPPSDDAEAEPGPAASRLRRRPPADRATRPRSRRRGRSSAVQ